MMIAAVELNGAKIGDHTRRIIRVCLNDAGGYPAVDIQTRQDPDQELAKEARHMVEEIHVVGRGIDLMDILAVKDLMAQILVDGLDVGFVLRVNNGQRLRRLVRKLLLYNEGHGYLIALIEVLVGNEPVHLRAQRDRLDESCHDNMEHGVGELCLRLVFLFEIRVHIGEVDRFSDIGLVVAAVRVDQRRNKVHTVQIAQQHTVLPVAPATFFLFHCNHTP